jgi:hypothetical protein
MIKLDEQLLVSLGLVGLSEKDQKDILDHMLETLQLRLGLRLTNRMTEEQFNEFQMYSDNDDQQGAFNWLKTNFPDYQEITQDEFNKLCLEVQQSAPAILAAIKEGDNPFSGDSN